MNSFNSRSTLRVGQKDYELYRLDALDKQGISTQHLPYSLRILLENLLRTEDGRNVTKEEVRALAAWNGNSKSDKEIAFTPSRVLLQDFTGVPCVVDLAAMRDAMGRLGGDPKTINPLQPVELVIDHSVQVCGEELGKMEQVEYEMVLQCSGNGRSKFSETFPIHGTPWGQGGVGNVRFAGVPLSAVLKQHNIKVDPEARFLTAQGKDVATDPESPDFEHSLPLADVLEKSILAVKLNGELLPAVHGGPVRLVTPGFYGTMHVKWLRRLSFAQTESNSFYHATEYRVPRDILKPGEEFTFTMENSIPTWNLRLMSFIFDPQPEATLQAGSQILSGVAFNDGSVPLETLLVSFDCGRSWNQATLHTPASSYAWHHWTIQTELKRGAYQVWCRAVDALGCSQPLDGSVFWNPNGYEWNGVHKIDVTVE